MTRLLSAALALLCLGSAPMMMLATAGSAAAGALLADIPAPPDAKALGNGSTASGGEEASYSTAANPAAVIRSYKDKLTAAGWTVTSAGGSRSSYGGGAGLQASNGPKYLSVNAGGPAGRTFVHVCVWPEKPKDDHCGD